MSLYTAVTHCRSCGSSQLAEVLDLGLFYISDFLPTADAHTDKAPLTLVRCDACSLVQLRHSVDRDRLYRNYHYLSGTQESMVQALRDVVAAATARVRLEPGDVVLDIGASDGTLLEQYPESCTRLAYEPAENIRHLLVQKRILVAGGYFPQQFSGLPTGLTQRAKAITSIACFYDVDDPGAFVEGIKENLALDGIWINQLAYLPATLATNNFGDICHEHLTYWTLDTLAALYNRHGLCITDVSYNDVNGGSLRVIARHARASAPVSLQIPDTDHVSRVDLKRFAQRARLNRSEVRDFLHAARREGKRVVGYGASTKGNTYLQYWDVGPDLLPTIADRNPAKWGTHTPTGQRVIAEEEMRAWPPDYLLVLPFHFLDSFIAREAVLLNQGTRFVIPFPALWLTGGEPYAVREPSSSPSTRWLHQAT